MPKLPWQPNSSSSFLPQDYVLGKQESRFVAITVALFLVVMVGVVGAFFITNKRWSTVRAQQRIIAAEYESESAKLEQLKTLEEQRTEMMDKANITTALLERAPRSVLLAELVTNLPDDATLVTIELISKRIRMAPVAEASRAAGKAKTASRSRKSKNEEPQPKPRVLPPKFEYELSIAGVAPTNNEIADYLRLLQGSPLLRDVELVLINETKLEDLELRRFEIEARLPDDADARKVDKAEEFTLELTDANRPTEDNE